MLKEVTSKMKLKQIQDYAMSCIKDLVEKLEQQNMQNVFDNKLDLQREESSSDLDMGIQSSQVDLKSIKFFLHKKRSQYNLDKISELNTLIRRHLNNLSVIRKYLKIQSSSFQRFMKE